MVTNNSINANSVGLAKYDGAGTWTGVTVTNHNILVGATSNGITSVAPSATSGIPVISQGAAADPIFGTAVVAGGGTGAVTLTGLLTGNGTSAITATAITQYNVITGGASNAPNSVAPTATSGIPLISQGAASQPIFGTAVVAGGGTGNTTFTAYSVICAGTTATGVFQNVSGVGTSGQLLTSNGASNLPSWTSPATFSSINIQTFTSSGTYTPTSGMKYCIIECVGGGGGGGATTSTTAGTVSCAGGGGGGGYARKFASAATVGGSQTVTIGAAGAAGATSGGTGGTGGTTSLGTICVAGPGVGGTGTGAVAVAFLGAPGGAQGFGTTGDVLIGGTPGGTGFAGVTWSVSGCGGSSGFGGGGGQSVTTATSGTGGNTGQNYGGGGAGGATGAASGTAAAGGAGSKGVIVVTEYI